MERDLTAIDLFSGAGGLHIGFEKVGFNILLCIDNDNQVEKTHLKNFRNIPFLNKDIRNISINEIKDYLNIDKELDIIIGGPPCQGFSTIGKRISSNPIKREQHDSRNDLVLVYVNIIKKLRPKFIVMENVKGLLTMKKGIYLDTILKELSNVGYNVDYRLINMADFGVPQIRERVLIIGNRIGQPVEFPIPDHFENPQIGQLPWRNCWDAIKDLVNTSDNPNFNHVSLKHTQPIIERYKYIPEGGRLPENDLPPELFRRNFGNTYKRLDRSKPALTMVPGNDAFPIHPVLNRSLTVREAARIQTFPDDVIFVGSRRQQGHQVGNAVPPLFSQKLALSIKEQLLEMREFKFVNGN